MRIKLLSFSPIMVTVRRSDSLPVLHHSTQRTSTIIVIALIVAILAALFGLVCYALYSRRDSRTKQHRSGSREKVGPTTSDPEVTRAAYSSNAKQEKRLVRCGTEELRDPGNLLGTLNLERFPRADCVDELDNNAKAHINPISASANIDLEKSIVSKAVEDVKSSIVSRPAIPVVDQESGLSVIIEEDDLCEFPNEASRTADKEGSTSIKEHRMPSNPAKSLTPHKQTLRRSMNTIELYGVVSPQHRNSCEPDDRCQDESIDCKAELFTAQHRPVSTKSETPDKAMPLSSHPWVPMQST